MASQLIPDERVQQLNDTESQHGDYVLYWMQQSQRAQDNHALEFAIQRANARGKPLLVCFGLTADYPDANARHFRFMLEGLQETAGELERRSLKFVLRLGDPATLAIELAKAADEVICDRGYLRHQREWRQQVATDAPCRVWQIESDLIVPVEVASQKREYAARTIRNKLQDHARDFLEELRTTAIDHDASGLNVRGESLNDIEHLIASLGTDDSVAPVDTFRGGTSQARARLQSFIENDLRDYQEQRLLIDEERVSHLSPYLHFGQVSPLTIASAIRATNDGDENSDAYLEELLVRRELAHNFVYYEPHYDSYRCLPDWAAETLAAHADDRREHHYTATQLEAAETHDDAWNAAMVQMKQRGYLHNYMRMYWGKKIIEWTNTPQHAYRTALDLNNKYFLDGRDPNSYTNIAWLFGLHDRPHPERPIFGKVRFLSANGLKRKFDIGRYIEQVLQGTE